MSGIKVRRARGEDAAAIARVHVETWRAAYAGLVPDDYLVGMSEQGQAFGWQKAIARRGRFETILVAEAEGGPLVGFGNAGVTRHGVLPWDAEVYTLYVAVDWQGQGTGRRLLGALFRALVRNGFNDAFLWVLASNPSRFFYEAMGGERAAERQEAFAGTKLNETAYAWPDLKAWLAAQGCSD